MFEALKSLYMTGFSASWRKARPLAAPIAIFILVDHGRETEYPAPNERVHESRLLFLHFSVWKNRELICYFPTKEIKKKGEEFFFPYQTYQTPSSGQEKFKQIGFFLLLNTSIYAIRTKEIP